MRSERMEIELEQATELIALTPPLAGEETASLLLARGMILARDVIADMDQPPFDRSPLDGYAMRAGDTVNASPDAPVTLEVVDKLCAGDPPRRNAVIETGQAVRIMTGAVIPPGCDCVIRQEDTDYGEKQVRIYRATLQHENICFRGEDFKAGSLLLGAGTKLNAAALGVLASAGVLHVNVRPKAKIALLVTGDELFELSPGKSLPPGKIYSSNLTMLHARLSELGFEPVSAVQTGDDPHVTAELIGEMLTQADAVITTGGVSVGEKDIFHEVMPLLGAERVFHGVNIKPGTPAMFSRCGEKPVLSLSGNPFAAAATFELLARPLLSALSGDSSLLPKKSSAVLAAAFGKKAASHRFVRGKLENGRITLPEGHSSGQLRSLVECNCLVEIPPNTQVREGEPVAIYLM